VVLEVGGSIPLVHPTDSLDAEARCERRVAGSGGRGRGIALDEPPAPERVFFHSQKSSRTPYESFLLGETGGDSNNGLAGSLTGTLLPNTSYSFEAWAFIQAVHGPDISPGPA
jgi:hypothetical protein